MQVAVIGAGSWGTAVANLVASKQPVTLWARRPDLAAHINSAHENPDYLPGYQLHDNVTATSDLLAGLSDADALVMGVPLIREPRFSALPRGSSASH